MYVAVYGLLKLHPARRRVTVSLVGVFLCGAPRDSLVEVEGVARWAVDSSPDHLRIRMMPRVFEFQGVGEDRELLWDVMGRAEEWFTKKVEEMNWVGVLG